MFSLQTQINRSVPIFEDYHSSRKYLKIFVEVESPELTDLARNRCGNTFGRVFYLFLTEKQLTSRVKEFAFSEAQS